VSGAQSGRVLWRRSLPSPLTYTDVPASSRLNLSFAGRALDVRLSEVPATSSCTATAALPPRESVRGLRLTVNGRVLQADARVPASRACAYAYSLEEVRVFADLVVVRVRVFTPGFEGPDAFALVVTGRWR
jgi:predicted secreted protein